MNIRKQIKDNLTRIRRNNEQRTKKYKQSLLKQLDENINKKKQSVQDNQGLINRYHGAKPQGLTQMQQAMEAAL
jgi:hypothetical protein